MLIRSLKFYPVSAIGSADRAPVLAAQLLVIIQLDNALSTVGNQDERGLCQNIILAVWILSVTQFIFAIVPAPGMAQTLLQ